MKIINALSITFVLFFIFIDVCRSNDFYNLPNMNTDSYENLIWRFAEKHEAGDLEPSDFCYIAIRKNTLLMHWISPSEPESIDVYKLTQKTKKSFCAKKIRAYTLEDSKYEINNDDQYHLNICGKILNNKMMLDNGITLKKTDAALGKGFPIEFLEKYMR